VRQASYATWARRWGCLLGLCMALPLVGCPSMYWTNPTKPSTAFADDATACEVEAAQAPTTSDTFDYNVFDADHYNAYIACLRGKGWELQQRP
jgi:hypothetical protein